MAYICDGNDTINMKIRKINLGNYFNECFHYKKSYHWVENLVNIKKLTNSLCKNKNRKDDTQENVMQGKPRNMDKCFYEARVWGH